MTQQPKLYSISSVDIKPFTEDNICNVSGTDFLAKCKNKIFQKLNWGDCIQIDDEYRNNSKYFWDDRWYGMNREYHDYGVLAQRFSIIDKNLPLDYFNATMYYNTGILPWNPIPYCSQLIVNAELNKKNKKFETYFMWRNKKIKLSTDLNDFCKDYLNGLDEDGRGGFNNGKKMINYVDLRVTENNFVVPEYLRKYVYEMYRYNDKSKSNKFGASFAAFLDDSDDSDENKVKITKYVDLKKGDIIKIQTNEKSFEKICNEYIFTKIEKDNNFCNDLRLKFIDSILKSKYLDLETDEPLDDESEYEVFY